MSTYVVGIQSENGSLFPEDGKGASVGDLSSEWG